MPRSTRPAAAGRPSVPPRERRASSDEGADLASRLCLARVPEWASYVHRGRRECAFSQLKLMGRIVNTIYDQALEPVGLRASQLALMWAIVATEPVDMTTLGEVTYSDQTTLSRTVQTLRRMRLVSVRPGADRRVKLLSLSPTGKARFAAAMPYWERAQREAGRVLPVDVVNELGRQVRRNVGPTAA